MSDRCRADDELDAALSRPVIDLSAEPFCAAVMQRVRGEAALLAPDEALAHAQRQVRRASAQGRATRVGAAIGVAVAVAAFAAFGGGEGWARADAGVMALGWLLAGASLAWTLLASERLSPGS
jgi:hypothetical protein